MFPWMYYKIEAEVSKIHQIVDISIDSTVDVQKILQYHVNAPDQYRINANIKVQNYTSFAYYYYYISMDMSARFFSMCTY